VEVIALASRRGAKRKRDGVIALSFLRGANSIGPFAINVHCIVDTQGRAHVSCGVHNRFNFSTHRNPLTTLSARLSRAMFIVPMSIYFVSIKE